MHICYYNIFPFLEHYMLWLLDNNKYYTVCCRYGSGKLFWLGLWFMNYERFLCVQSQFMLKTIPAWYWPTMIFSKNWKHISKIKWNPKIWAKIQIEFFCKKNFLIFLVQNVFWNFKIQRVKNLKFFIFKIFHKPHFTDGPYAKIRCKI